MYDAYGGMKMTLKMLDFSTILKIIFKNLDIKLFVLYAKMMACSFSTFLECKISPFFGIICI